MKNHFQFELIRKRFFLSFNSLGILVTVLFNLLLQIKNGPMKTIPWLGGAAIYSLSVFGRKNLFCYVFIMQYQLNS